MLIIYICGSLKFEILNYCKYKLSAYSPLSPIAQPVHKNNSISTFISLQSSVSLVSTLTFFTLKFNLYMYSTLYWTQNASVKIYINMYIFLTKNSFILDIKLYIFFHMSSSLESFVNLYTSLWTKSGRKSFFLHHQLEQTVFTRTFETNRPIGPLVCQNIVPPPP